MYSSKQRQHIIYWTAIGVVVITIIIMTYSIITWRSVVAQSQSPAVLATDALETEPSPTGEDFLEATVPEDAISDDSAAEEATAAPHVQQETPVAEPVVVYITGAVKHPNTYALPPKARVKDAVMRAGGLTNDADSEHINLAEHISDAEHIHIPHIGEGATPATGNNAPSEESKDSQAHAGLININTASVAEFDPLPGIGKVIAQRIIDWRTDNGPFESIVDLKKVKGITPAVYDKIKDLITVS